jgi:hypothetical protein
MRMFGNHQVFGGFWNLSKEYGCPSESIFELGSVDFLDKLKSGEASIYGGGTSVKKVLSRDTIHDCDLYFSHNDPSRWDGTDTRPEFTLSISGQWLNELGVETYLDNLKDYFEIADRHSPPYGLIDLATPDDALAGWVYGSVNFMQTPIHRRVELANWVYSASKRGDRARGIYWGNYFGPKILAKLGGREEFLKRYREQTTLKDGTPIAHIWEFANGVFVSLSMNPLKCKPGIPLDIGTIFNLQWLVKTLGSCGVLNSWDETTKK